MMKGCLRFIFFVFMGGLLLVFVSLVFWWFYFLQPDSVTGDIRNFVAESTESLAVGSRIVVKISANSVEPSFDGKLVHLSGEAFSDEAIIDPAFGISSKSLGLKRNVEMYQWKQTIEKPYDPYEYVKIWSMDEITSSYFKDATNHSNPQMTWQSETFMASKINLGAFQLPPNLIRLTNKFTDFESMELNKQIIDLGTNKSIRNMKVLPGMIYIGDDPDLPKIGDYRIWFEQAVPTSVTLVAKQSKNSFAPYKTDAGGEIELYVDGVFTAEQMFVRFQEANKLLDKLSPLFRFMPRH